MIPSVRLLTRATQARLDAHTALVVYPSVVAPFTDTTGTKHEAPAVGANSLLTKGYAVLHPGGGDALPDNLAGTPGRLLWSFQVSCVGSSHDQVGWVVDEVRELLDGHTLAVADTVVGRIQPPLGYQAPPPRPLFEATPPRLMVPLQYQVLAAS